MEGVFDGDELFSTSGANDGAPLYLARVNFRVRVRRVFVPDKLMPFCMVWLRALFDDVCEMRQEVLPLHSARLSFCLEQHPPEFAGGCQSGDHRKRPGLGGRQRSLRSERSPAVPVSGSRCFTVEVRLIHPPENHFGA